MKHFCHLILSPNLTDVHQSETVNSQDFQQNDTFRAISKPWNLKRKYRMFLISVYEFMKHWVQDKYQIWELERQVTLNKGGL